MRFPDPNASDGKQECSDGNCFIGTERAIVFRKQNDCQQQEQRIQHMCIK